MDLEHINPWLHLWTSPKKTMRFILNSNPYRHILWLAALSGILAGGLWSFMLWKQDHTALTIFFAIIFLIGGGVVGILALYVEGWLYYLTGYWIGGKGSFIDLKCAVGWRNYPAIVALIFNGLNILAIPNPWLQALFGLIYATLTIWTLIISVNLIGEAHRFSAWKGLLTLIIALVLVTVFLILIGLLLPLLKPLFQ